MPYEILVFKKSPWKKEENPEMAFIRFKNGVCRNQTLYERIKSENWLLHTRRRSDLQKGRKKVINPELFGIQSPKDKLKTEVLQMNETASTTTVAPAPEKKRQRNPVDKDLMKVLSDELVASGKDLTSFLRDKEMDSQKANLYNYLKANSIEVVKGKKGRRPNPKTEAKADEAPAEATTPPIPAATEVPANPAAVA